MGEAAGGRCQRPGHSSLSSRLAFLLSGGGQGPNSSLLEREMFLPSDMHQLLCNRYANRASNQQLSQGTALVLPWR